MRQFYKSNYQSKAKKMIYEIVVSMESEHMSLQLNKELRVKDQDKELMLKKMFSYVEYLL